MEVFFHGTSSVLGITDILLPPTKTTLLAELGRKKNLDKVFFTLDFNSAGIYADKAVKRFGGKPIVLRVLPNGKIVVVQARKGTTVYMADSAKVLQ